MVLASDATQERTSLCGLHVGREDNLVVSYKSLLGELDDVVNRDTASDLHFGQLDLIVDEAHVISFQGSEAE